MGVSEEDRVLEELELKLDRESDRDFFHPKKKKARKLNLAFIEIVFTRNLKEIVEGEKEREI